MRLNLLAPINSTGYGVASLNILLSLYKLGHHINWLPLGGQPGAPEQYVEILSQCAQNSRLFEKNDPTLKIWHQYDLGQNLGRGKLVSFPFFELDTLADIERHHLGQQDTILVASNWAKQVIENNEIKIPVVVAPLGVDRTIFNENVDTSNNILSKSTNTKFLCVGKWEIRKGHDIVCEAFNRAFLETDNVELVMICFNPFLTKTQNEEWARMYKLSKLGEKISIFGQKLNSQEEVANMMAACDCGIFCSRAEAWNLELLEMMSCGKHVIATNTTGHSEFVNDTNSYLIKTTKMEWAFDNRFFDGKIGKWSVLGEEQIEQLKEHMVDVHNRRQEGANGGLINFDGIETAKKFSWENTANKVLEGICL